MKERKCEGEMRSGCGIAAVGVCPSRTPINLLGRQNHVDVDERLLALLMLLELLLA
jgi:hypothetical protein